ncbi:hypothetical protein H4J58_01825 [Colwellia sp. MB3u-70]|uniref:hypothetical protein n=1 Tax=unclassified Colwellia TaxID=196834 RepID=UPI0015F48653|nr:MULTISPECIES: hypothetical protein [unclassified Colwellia]MBA6291438.1 hypothetical protein [Colwellia sp. MB3u-8]MBA6305875.1 hypothetical protein [Colwellia sp. MB3u-70]
MAVVESLSYLYQNNVPVEIIAPLFNKTVAMIRSKLVLMRLYKASTHTREDSSRPKRKLDYVDEISYLLKIGNLSTFEKMDKRFLCVLTERVNDCIKGSFKPNKSEIYLFQQQYEKPEIRKKTLIEVIAKILGMENSEHLYTMEKAEKSQLLDFCDAITTHLK